jgi:ATP synthase protein I
MSGDAAGKDDELAAQARRSSRRRQNWLREGDPTLARQVARVGVLGWMIVTPTLLGTFAGRRLDRAFGSGVFWTAPLMLAGLALGCWSAWKWMHTP